jgi:basic membrane protein A
MRPDVEILPDRLNFLDRMINEWAPSAIRGAVRRIEGQWRVLMPQFMQGIARRAFIALAGAAAVSAGLSGAARAADALKVAAIYTVPVEQQWVSRIHKALTAAQARGEVVYTYSENVANTDYERVMREYAEGGMGLIVGEAFAVERAARKVAADYPDTAFLMGSSFGPAQPNFAVFDNWIHEPSYLSGLIAGKATTSNVIGMVGGFAIPEVNRLMHAFMAGARESNPEVKFLVTFINSWYDPPKAKESAFAMMDAGADVMYAERFGVSDAAVERGVKAIGNVIDTSEDYPGTILASALWHMEPTIDRAVAAVTGGTFEPADYGQYSFMSYGGGSLVYDASLVPADVAAMVEAKRADIMAGMFRVDVNDGEPKSDR